MTKVSEARNRVRMALEAKESAEGIIPVTDLVFSSVSGTEVLPFLVDRLQYSTVHTQVGSPRRPLSDRDFTAIQVQFVEPAASAQVTQTITDVLDATRLLAVEVAKLREALRERRTLLLGSLDAEQITLRTPLPVEVLTEDGLVVAHSPDLEVRGSGESEYEALEDLRESLVEEYEFLKANEQSLGVVPRAQLRRFRELLQETR